MGDEGIGVHAVREMQKESLPEHIVCMDGGTGGLTLLEPLQEAKRIIIIDATIDGAHPGYVCRLIPKFSKDYPTSLTAHDIGLKDLLDAFYLLGSVPDVVLFAVSIAPLRSGLSVNLSPEITKALPTIIEQVKKEIGLSLN